MIEKNKLFIIYKTNLEDTLIVAAKTAKEAFELVFEEHYYDEEMRKELKVEPINSKQSFIQYEPEIEFKLIPGLSKIYTNLKTGVVEWEEFVSELDKRQLLIVDDDAFDHHFNYLDSKTYYGLNKEEFQKVVEKVDYYVCNFSEFAEIYGIDSKKITFEQANKLITEQLTLPELKKIQNGMKNYVH